MNAPAEVARFEEAVAYFRQRMPDLVADDVESLLAVMRLRARTWSSKAQLDLATTVWEGIEAAVADGETFADFKARISDVVTRGFGGAAQPEAWWLERIFRTNVQRAYGGGRVRQLSEPDVLAARPFWRFSAVFDSRTSETCKACRGTVLPANHPWWRTHQPPLHHSCRSTIIPMTARAGEAALTKRPPRVEPEEGFGNVEVDPIPRVELRKYPPELVEKWKGPTQ